MDAGDLGELRVTDELRSYKDYDMKNRFFNRNLAGGALLDIGVYALSFVRMFLSSCPDQITSQVKAGAYRCGRAGGNSSDEPGSRRWRR